MEAIYIDTAKECQTTHNEDDISEIKAFPILFQIDINSKSLSYKSKEQIK